MKTQIDKNRLDMDRVRQEIRYESRKFILQAILALVAAVGTGIAIGHFWLHG